MNRKSKTDHTKRGGAEDEEVDLLLRAAEDELLLNLTLNSHTSRGHASNSYIDPDLDRRFQSLKSSRPTATSTNKAAAQPPPKLQPPAAASSSSSSAADDDLLTRFAALKGSLPSSSYSSSFQSNCLDEQSKRLTTASDGVDEDEVQKLIQWAVDAARLDLSPPTDTDDEAYDVDTSNDDSDDSFSDNGDSTHHQKKGGRKKGQKDK